MITDRAERLDPGSVLASDRGEMLVRASRPHQRDWIVAFEGIADRNTAETLRGLVLRAEPLEDPEALWVHELVGCHVVELVLGLDAVLDVAHDDGVGAAPPLNSAQAPDCSRIRCTRSVG